MLKRHADYQDSAFRSRPSQAVGSIFSAIAHATSPERMSAKSFLNPVRDAHHRPPTCFAGNWPVRQHVVSLPLTSSDIVRDRLDAPKQVLG